MDKEPALSVDQLAAQLVKLSELYSELMKEHSRLIADLCGKGYADIKLLRQGWRRDD